MLQVEGVQSNATVIYRRSNIIDLTRLINRSHCGSRKVKWTGPPATSDIDDTPLLGKALRLDGSVCELGIVIDHTYYKDFAGSNWAVAVSKIAHHVAQADAVFRTTDMDLDGIPDNIGFKINDEITVYASADADDYKFSDLSLNVTQLHDAVSLYNYDKFCVVIAFFYRDFGQTLHLLQYLYVSYLRGGGTGSARCPSPVHVREAQFFFCVLCLHNAEFGQLFSVKYLKLLYYH